MKRYPASMFAGFPLGGRRRPEFCVPYRRSTLWNETQTDGPRVVVKRTDSAALPFALDDEKQMLRRLNDRLSVYLETVKNLQESNEGLRLTIETIKAKRKAPKGRDWHETQETLKHLRQQIKDISMENAKLLIDSDNAKKAYNDVTNKLDGEINAQKVLLKELEDIEKAEKEIEQQKTITMNDTDIKTGDIHDILKKHNERVDDLCAQISMSKVIVEIHPESTKLTSVLDKIRLDYEKIVQKNQRDRDNVYSSQIKDLEEVEARHIKELESGIAELKKNQKDKQELEWTLETVLGEIKVLELKKKRENTSNNHLDFFIQNLKQEIEELNWEWERTVNMGPGRTELEVEEEIKKYRELLAIGDQRLGLPLPDALDSDKLNGDVVQQSKK